MILRQARDVITDVNPVTLTPFDPSEINIPKTFFVFKMTGQKRTNKKETKQNLERRGLNRLLRGFLDSDASLFAHSGDDSYH